MVKLFTLKLKIRNTTIRLFGLTRETVMDVLNVQDPYYEHWLDDDYNIIVSDLATHDEQYAGTWSELDCDSEDDCPFVANTITNFVG